MSSNILFIIPDILFVILFVIEFNKLKDCKKAFTCSHCNNIMERLRSEDKCTQCHRTMKLDSKYWDHFFTLKTTYIDNSNKRYEYNYKSYKKAFMLELTICGLGIVILTLMSISGILNMLG